MLEVFFYLHSTLTDEKSVVVQVCNCNLTSVCKDFTCFSLRDYTKSIFFSCRRIIWLGDLNYRINLSYEKTRELVSKKEWSKLAEKDQVHFFFLFRYVVLLKLSLLIDNVCLISSHICLLVPAYIDHEIHCGFVLVLCYSLFLLTDLCVQILGQYLRQIPIS